MLPTREEMQKALELRHGKELQDKFGKATVAVCGLGGLGSNVAIALARAGVGRLHLIDFDIVDLANLNRQQYEVLQMGEYKTDAMKCILSKIAPYCNVVTDAVKLDDDNIGDILKDDSIVCECFDNPESKAVLVNTVSELFPEKYIVAASGMSGLYSTNTIRTKKIAKKFYVCGDGECSVEKDGTMFATRVMCCAAHEANTVLRIIAEKFEA